MIMTPEGRPDDTDYSDAAAAIRARIGEVPSLGLILGSGLGTFAQNIKSTKSIPYTDIPRFPLTGAPGHEGKMSVGGCAGKRLIIMQGRVHAYEGYETAQVVFPIRVLHMLGVRDLIITNAAGGVNPDFQRGDFMMITDHLNLPGMAGLDPMRGPNMTAFGPRFTNMASAYNGAHRQTARRAAAALSMDLKEGVYAYLVGPCFETPAEIRALRLLGADATGMSTVPEVLTANHCGMAVLGLSVITNMAVDHIDSGSATTAQEVFETTKRIAPDFARLLIKVIGDMG